MSYDRGYYERNKVKIIAAAVRGARKRKPRLFADLKSEQVDRRFQHSTTDDMEYSAEELEWFRAVDGFKADKHEPFPTLRDLLRILTQLGYAKRVEQADSGMSAYRGMHRRDECHAAKTQWWND